MQKTSCPCSDAHSCWLWIYCIWNFVRENVWFEYSSYYTYVAGVFVVNLLQQKDAKTIVLLLRRCCLRLLLLLLIQLLPTLFFCLF